MPSLFPSVCTFSLCLALSLTPTQKQENKSICNSCGFMSLLKTNMTHTLNSTMITAPILPRSAFLSLLLILLLLKSLFKLLCPWPPSPFHQGLLISLSYFGSKWGVGPHIVEFCLLVWNIYSTVCLYVLMHWKPCVEKYVWTAFECWFNNIKNIYFNWPEEMVRNPQCAS